MLDGPQSVSGITSVAPQHSPSMRMETEGCSEVIVPKPYLSLLADWLILTKVSSAVTMELTTDGSHLVDDVQAPFLLLLSLLYVNRSVLW